jgi:hypothetical protein
MTTAKKKPIAKKKTSQTNKKVSPTVDFTTYGVTVVVLLSFIFLVVIIVKYL